MNLNNHAMEIAYGILFIVSWAWAFSQLKVAIKRGGSWRWSVAVWLLTKANFLTQAGIIWWFNWANPVLLEWSVFLFAAGHVWSFINWLRLGGEPDPMPTRDMLGREIPHGHQPK
jgi:hypothetical protein